ncbi:hypothetical protein DERF_007865 [Dermatophagoides farinae]|uniref:Transcriptional regulator ATRX homolog n=1 Tax=Dermatophagoides farinae TaxID=6954 RepID=A0A922I4D8_DERFA|nr:hypothetical protein DERF_007865 [Dermatophagoides farinae]
MIRGNLNKSQIEGDLHAANEKLSNLTVVQNTIIANNPLNRTNIGSPSTGVNMNLMKELITKSIDDIKKNDVNYTGTRSWTRQKFDQILLNLQTSLLSQIETNHSRLLITTNTGTAVAAPTIVDNTMAHSSPIIISSSSSSSSHTTTTTKAKNNETVIIDIPEQKSTIKMEDGGDNLGMTKKPMAIVNNVQQQQSSSSSSKQKHFHNVFSFTEKLDAKPTKKKQQGRPKRQKQPTKTTTELTNVDSQFADIDSDDEIELVMEISHSSHHHQEKPSKILKLDNSSAEKETNDDGEINMDKDGDKSVHLEVLEKMNEEFRQEEDYKPVVAMDCQNLKRNFFKTNLQNIDINNNDDDHPMDSSIVYTRRCLRAIRGFHDLNPRTQKTIREDIDRCERLKMKKKSLKEFLAKMSITSDRLILDIDKQNEKILIEVDEGFVQILKSHQRDGIQFMFDCTIESVDRLKNHCHQTGCILAHSMGLGKTLQAVAYLHTIMTNQHTARFIRKALIIVPYNVHKNWQDEIQKWLDECRRYFNIVRYDLSRSKSISERLATIKDWHQTGGILVMTIGTYTRLVLGRSFHEEESPEGMAIVKDCLLTPDVFIMDEGHLLKNSSSQINRATSLIVTSRRIILTGTPMQNNLEEYFVMVDFVKPNLLGTIHEFRNRFINPITNGQHIDSTDFDVNFMKKRVHVLFKMLQPSIHRCDYQVLVPDLPPKQEYIVYLQLTDIQAKLYQYYLDNITKKSQQNLFKDFWVLLLLNNHPALLIDMYEKQYDVRMDNDYTIAQNDDYNNNNRSPTINDLSMTKRKTFSRNKNNNNKQQQWWTAIIDERYNIRCMELSSKFIIMFEIIGECQKLNDKLVIFSQSLINLDMIELMLSKCSNCDWSRDVDYFRIDGKVTVETRHRIIQTFNDESNKKARLLLLSTRSGGIGINLVGANRCIIFDCSWNPALDTQAIFRIFRYGQRKPCFVYRLAGFGTMENRIYQRQVAKLSTSKRVVDEKQIRRYFTLRQLEELYTFMRKPLYPQTLPVPRDDLLASLIRKYPGHILLYYEHDSLLQNHPYMTIGVTITIVMIIIIILFAWFYCYWQFCRSCLIPVNGNIEQTSRPFFRNDRYHQMMMNQLSEKSLRITSEKQQQQQRPSLSSNSFKSNIMDFIKSRLYTPKAIDPMTTKIESLKIEKSINKQKQQQQKVMVKERKQKQKFSPLTSLSSAKRINSSSLDYTPPATIDLLLSGQQQLPPPPQQQQQQQSFFGSRISDSLNLLRNIQKQSPKNR